MKFPRDAPKQRVIKTFEALGFRVMKIANHIAMVRENSDGSRTPMTMPNHDTIKGSTLRTICTQTGVSRDTFLDAYDNC